MGIRNEKDIDKDIDKEICKLKSVLEDMVYQNNMKNLSSEEILVVSRELDKLIVGNMRRRIKENLTI